MTVTNTSVREDYTAAGGAENFPITFNFKLNSEIKVYLDDVEIVNGGGAGEFSFVGGDPATDITFNDNPAGGEEVVIIRSTALTQGTDYTAFDGFPAASHEDALDKLTRQVQELDERSGRALTLAESSSTSDLELPEPESDKFLGWNAAGDELENKDSTAASDHDDLTNVTSDQHHAELHSIASHNDTTATGAELETLTDGSNADALHIHSAVGAHTIASHSDTTATGAELETLTDGSNADALHAHASPAHTIASHSDTTATGAELDTLTDGSNADALHTHAGAAATAAPSWRLTGPFNTPLDNIDGTLGFNSAQVWTQARVTFTDGKAAQYDFDIVADDGTVSFSVTPAGAGASSTTVVIAATATAYARVDLKTVPAGTSEDIHVLLS